MTQPVDTTAPAIGACLPCRQIFLVTPGSANCLTCGQPPTLTMPFPTAHPEPVEAPEEEAEPLLSEDPSDRLRVGSAEYRRIIEPEEEAPPSQDEEEEEGSDLINAIADYLEGSEPTSEWVLADLQELGADPETAATAVGRLAAVRELIAQLAQPQELPPNVPDEEEDRTTVLSP